MDHEVLVVPCPNCAAASESSSAPDRDRWQCQRCGHAYYLRRCSFCGHVSHVRALTGWHQPWECVRCGEINIGFSQNRDPAAATVAELAADTAGIVGTGPGMVPAPGRGRAPRWTRPRFVVPAVVVVAVLVAAGVTVASTGSPAGQAGTAPAGPVPMTRAVSVTASSVRTVELAGVPGQLTITGASSDRVTLTGQLRWTGRAPLVTTRLDHGVLSLSYRCAAASPCSENYQLTVSRQATTVVRQPGGRVVISGLTGPLSITAGNVDVLASGLRSPVLAAVIASGHLSARFDAPPARVSVTLMSAQAELMLPGSVTYRVLGQVTSGNIDAAIPQATGSRRVVSARINSGELTLLPS